MINYRPASSVELTLCLEGTLQRNRVNHTRMFEYNQSNEHVGQILIHARQGMLSNRVSFIVYYSCSFHASRTDSLVNSVIFSSTSFTTIEQGSGVRNLSYLSWYICSNSSLGSSIDHHNSVACVRTNTLHGVTATGAFERRWFTATLYPMHNLPHPILYVHSLYHDYPTSVHRIHAFPPLMTLKKGIASQSLRSTNMTSILWFVILLYPSVYQYRNLHHPYERNHIHYMAMLL